MTWTKVEWKDESISFNKIWFWLQETEGNIFSYRFDWYLNGDATLKGDAPTRPIGRKKAKQLLRRGGADGYIEALDNLWEKKKQADVDKELKKKDSTNH
jgi:hypothetical protein